MKYPRLLASLIALLSCFFFNGCASSGSGRIKAVTKNPSIRLNSEPAGAVLFFGTNFYGKCPVAMPFSIIHSQRVAGTVSLTLPAAVWPSGARISEIQHDFDITAEDDAKDYLYHHPDSTGQRLEYDRLGYYELLLKVESQPEGAEIFYRNQPLGTAPVTIREKIVPQNYSNGCVIFEELVAQWKSGARSPTNRILASIAQSYRPSIVLTRPIDAPNSEVDFKHEAHLIWNRTYGNNPPTTYVLIKSDPSGATLYNGQTNHGPCPVSLEYKLTFEDFQKKTVSLLGFSVRWQSGVTKDCGPLTFNCDNQLSAEFTYLRPPTAQGLEIDANYAIEQQRLIAEKKRLEQEQENQRRLLALQKQQYEKAAALEQARQKQFIAQQEEARRQQAILMIMNNNQQNANQLQQMQMQQQQNYLNTLRSTQYRSSQPQTPSPSWTLQYNYMQGNWQYAPPGSSLKYNYMENRWEFVP